MSSADLIQTTEQNAASSFVDLPPGATPDQIAATERELGVTFPEPMKAFYLAHDGGGPEYHCRGHLLLSLEGIVAEWREWKARVEAEAELDEEEAAEEDSEAEDEDDDYPVKQQAWLPGWIPVTTDGDGYSLMVDLDPGAGGQAGQVISVNDEGGVRLLEGPDFLTWLSDVAWYGASMAPGAGEDDDDEDDEDEDDEPTFDAERAVFARFDPAGKGVVARGLLPEILAALGTPEDVDAAQQVIDHVKAFSFGSPGPDELSWSELAAWLKSDKPG